jgi:hypothetical protein
VNWDEVSTVSRISRSEVACKVGHARAYEQGGRDGWLLVCEDDAELRAPVVERVVGLLAGLAAATPTIVSLYLGPWSVVRVRDPEVPLLDCAIPPDGSVCYFINEAARDLAARRWETVRPADWPVWARRCRFLIVPGGARPLPDAVSLIGTDSNRHARAVGSLPAAARRLGQVSGAMVFARSSRGVYGVRDWWFWEIRQRVLWRLPALAGARRSNRWLRGDGTVELN